MSDAFWSLLDRWCTFVGDDAVGCAMAFGCVMVILGVAGLLALLLI